MAVAVLAAGAASSGAAVTTAGAAALCENDRTGLVPLTDGGPGETYLGEPLGLYPGGTSVAPATHTARGVAIGDAMRPLDVAGNPDPRGRIVLLGVGGSNVQGEFEDFIASLPSVNPSLTLVNAGVGGRDLRDWANPTSDVWAIMETRLAAAGVTAAQVTAIWMKNAVARNFVSAFEPWVEMNVAPMRTILQEFEARFPSLGQVFLSSRSYGDYIDNRAATVEPYAYQTGFAVRRVVEDSIVDGAGLWVDWGPYIWTDGVVGRDDGMVWTCADVTGNGAHASDLGKAKITALLRAHFMNSPTTSWFQASAEDTLSVTAVVPSSLARGTRRGSITLTGTGFEAGATASFGPGTTVKSLTVPGALSAAAVVNVNATASPGPRDVTFVNPDGETTTCLACFSVV